MSVPGLPPLREVIRRHGLDARKGLGQHFLLDLNITDKIARAAGVLTGRDVLEVGPGPGGLTRALLETDAARVVAVEKDERCIAALAQLAAVYPGRLEVIRADALETEAAELVRPGAAIIANLPYNVGTPLLFRWLARPDHFGSMTLMFQREVAERIAARPGTKHYGRLAVMANWRWSTRVLFDLPPRAFTPPPKVTSAVVGLTPRTEALAPADAGTLSRVVAAAFNQRRKMLRQSLKGLRPDAEAWLGEAGIDPRRRAETLTVEEFCALARTLQSPR
ncbi:MAG: 16S rRNA (adenine(1518)-N(6)/adenine(1519)-N(6))-dimethyltransferase [Rhizobiales bacterium NRL2]|jgi:16S rRNA (adenine1518-N6/adenine1519-N6)-dimethyltransferase|nr:MAG: 16S rRNA (adenine(1518)-N(6)/adenine(1519)-N(6))-dimethyltransferase [Rhizobiales bacterium NRL2]